MKVFQKFTLILIISLITFSCKEKESTPKTEIDQRTSIEMTTNYGTMVLELYNETPLHRDNFIKLVNEKMYDSLLFHRVIEGFMIQGGDPDSRLAKPGTLLGEGDLDYTVKSEFQPHLFHQKGALATAREDNKDRASSAMQFFIVQGKVYNDSILDVVETYINKNLVRHHVINDTAHQHLWDSLQKAIQIKNDALYELYSDQIDSIGKTYEAFERYVIPPTHRQVYKTQGGTPTLDQSYTVFGQVVKGIKVVDSIAAIKTDENDRPVSDVRILSVRILK